MNLLNVLTGFYGKLHNYPGVPYWVLTPFRRIIRGIANKFLPQYLNFLYEGRKDREVQGNLKSVIVSFTSFPARIDNVWQVVECMMNQTLLPKKILLWLSKEQIKNRDSIPKKLREMENDIFQIRLVDGDIRSHKKYYYAVKEYPDDLIFLIDDDIYYPTYILEKSYKALCNHPNSIVCNYGYSITFDKQGRHKSYSKWVPLYRGAEGKNLFFGSGGGTLFKPSVLHHDILNIEKAIELTPFADDIWLNAMAKLAGLSLYILPSGLILDIKTNSPTLRSINNGHLMNDKQIDQIEQYYGRCFDRKN